WRSAVGQREGRATTATTVRATPVPRRPASSGPTARNRSRAPSVQCPDASPRVHGNEAGPVGAPLPTSDRTVELEDTSMEQAFRKLVDQVEQVIQGKRDAVQLALVCLFAQGHLLIEDVPGVGKTSLAKAIA